MIRYDQLPVETSEEKLSREIWEDIFYRLQAVRARADLSPVDDERIYLEVLMDSFRRMRDLETELVAVQARLTDLSAQLEKLQAQPSRKKSTFTPGKTPRR